MRLYVKEMTSSFQGEAVMEVVVAMVEEVVVVVDMEEVAAVMEVVVVATAVAVEVVVISSAFSPTTDYVFS